MTVCYIKYGQFLNFKTKRQTFEHIAEYDKQTKREKKREKIYSRNEHYTNNI